MDFKEVKRRDKALPIEKIIFVIMGLALITVVTVKTMNSNESSGLTKNEVLISE